MSPNQPPGEVSCLPSKKLGLALSSPYGSGKEHVQLEHNWARGRCTREWVYTEDMAAWRFKIDHENQTLLCTSTIGEEPLVPSRSLVKVHYPTWNS